VLYEQPIGSASASYRHSRQASAAAILLSTGTPVEPSKLEVADIFRRYGEAYRQKFGASLSTAQRRVMTAIEVCQTSLSPKTPYARNPLILLSDDGKVVFSC